MEKNIIIMPEIILKILELFKKMLPKKDAADPKSINIIEKPKVKKTVLTTKELFLLLLSWSKDVPEI